MRSSPLAPRVTTRKVFFAIFDSLSQHGPRRWRLNGPVVRARRVAPSQTNGRSQWVDALIAPTVGQWAEILSALRGYRLATCSASYVFPRRLIGRIGAMSPIGQISPIKPG